MGLAMSLNLDIDSLPPEQVEAAITRLEAMKAQRAAENKLLHYRPYPKQVAFHAAGVRCRERLLIAANQSGKSLAGAMECAMHAVEGQALRQANDGLGCRHDERDDTRYGAANPCRQAGPSGHGRHSERCHH